MNLPYILDDLKICYFKNQKLFGGPYTLKILAKYFGLRHRIDCVASILNVLLNKIDRVGTILKGLRSKIDRVGTIWKVLRNKIDRVGKILKGHLQYIV